MISKELENLMKSSLNDFILTGVLDVSDEIVQFLPDFTLMYLKLDDKYIAFESVEQYSKLKISVVDSIAYHKIDDPDFKYSFVSLLELLVINGTYSSTKINKIDAYNADEQATYFECDAAKVELTNEQTFFFDPCNFWGLTIGDNTVEKKYESNLNNNDVLKRITIVSTKSDDLIN